MSDFESTVAAAAVGIDLGTTNSVVAVYKDGEVHVLTDEEGHNFTPSVVAFTDTEQLVGWRALKQYAQNPDNTVSEVMRLMGRKFSELQVLEDIKRWPFTVVEKQGEPRLQVEYRSETRLYRPEQGILLLKLKQMACDFLEVPPFSQLDAVITVPVYFNDSQRLATKEAGEIAGLNITRIITEPAAAAVAYGMQNKAANVPSRRVLVFDMGGGTTDVSLLRMDGGSQYTVLGCRGGNHLGGEDIDTLLVNHCLDHFHAQHKVRLEGNRPAMTRLRRATEKAKCSLSTGTRAHIELDEIVPGVCFKYDVSRNTFQELVEVLLQRAVRLVGKCLGETNLTQIDQVVLAGGSTRIPHVKLLLSELLPGVELHCSINQEEAVAYGAAVQAAKDKNVLRETFLLSEVIPWSLGVALFDGTVNKVLQRHTPIPVKNQEVYHTLDNNQNSLIFDVYEGEGVKSKDNKFLASMTLSNIKRAPACEVAADTTFEIDQFGILQITAIEQGTDNTISVRIDRYKKHLTGGEVGSLSTEAQHENLHGLVHNLCHQMAELHAVTSNQEELSEEQRQMVVSEAARTQQWAANNPNPSASDYGVMVADLRSNLAFCAKIANSGNITYKPSE